MRRRAPAIRSDAFCDSGAFRDARRVGVLSHRRLSACGRAAPVPPARANDRAARVPPYARARVVQDRPGGNVRAHAHVHGRVRGRGRARECAQTRRGSAHVYVCERVRAHARGYDRAYLPSDFLSLLSLAESQLGFTNLSRIRKDLCVIQCVRPTDFPNR